MGGVPVADSPIGPLPVTFSGTLPCADCKGERYKVTLQADRWFFDATSKSRSGDSQGTDLGCGRWRLSEGGRILSLDSGADAYGNDWRTIWRVEDDHSLRLVVWNDDTTDVRIGGRITRTDRVSSSGNDPPCHHVATLVSERWVLRRLGRHKVKPADPEHEPWLIFEPRTGIVEGSAGCNRFTGSFEKGVTTLRMKSFGMTRMACQGLRQEAAFMNALERTWHYRVTDRWLELADEHGVVLAKLEEDNR